jgi:hypothetical protein
VAGKWREGSGGDSVVRGRRRKTSVPFIVSATT